MGHSVRGLRSAAVALETRVERKEIRQLVTEMKEWGRTGVTVPKEETGTGMCHSGRDHQDSAV